MNYFRTDDTLSEFINNYTISNDDLELFYTFIVKQNYIEEFCKDNLFFLKNKSKIVEKWFYFLQKQNPAIKQNKTKNYGNTIYRATFGESYDLKQLANSPLHFAAGSNGTGLYAVTESRFAKSYIKNHLSKKFTQFDNKTGNILKICIDKNSIVINKLDIFRACKRFEKEITQMDLPDDFKNLFISFVSSDISISALLLGADAIFLPNGHIIILNKDILIFPENQTDFEKCTLKIDLEKFRNQDKTEHEKADNFLQK